uniref:Uncharacterized protein n=1 Tax=viral metagenome TaxID=1070528 RepID=A0A6C0E1Q1_9ZZZZ
MTHKRTKKTKKINKRRRYSKSGGQKPAPFDSEIPAIEMEESFTLEDQPLNDSFLVEENTIEPINEVSGSQGPLALDDLNISDQNGSNMLDNTNSSLGLGNWENPNYSGNTTFESVLSEPSMEIGGKKRSRNRKSPKFNKTKRSRKSKKMKKVKKNRKTRKYNKRKVGGTNTDTEDLSPPAYNESYDEL